MNIVKVACCSAFSLLIGINSFAEDAEITKDVKTCDAGVKVEKPVLPRQKRGAIRFKEMDTDQSGALSLDEFKVAHQKRMDALKKRLGDKWDEDKMAKRPGPEVIFKAKDTDADGQLSLEEMNAMQPRRGGRDAKGHGKGNMKGTKKGAADNAAE